MSAGDKEHMRPVPTTGLYMQQFGRALRPTPHRAVTIDPAYFVALSNERDALAKRVDELLLANNREVQERRRYKALWEESQDELATVRGERDAYKAEARDYHDREIMSARSAPDKAAGGGEGEKVEYVFGPWVEGGERPNLPDDVLVDICMAEEKVGEHRIEVLPVDAWIGWGGGECYSPTHYRRAYRIGEWHDWDGSNGGAPFDVDAVEFESRDRDGTTYDSKIWASFDWRDIPDDDQTVAFRPLAAPGDEK